MSQKSLHDVWQRMHQQNQQRIINEQRNQALANQEAEARRMEWLKREKMFEAAASSNSASTAAAGGGIPTFEWITYENTAWIYPQSDLDQAVINMSTPGLSPSSLIGPTVDAGLTYSSVTFTKVDDYTYEFPTIQELINFYGEMFFQTSVSNPGSNAGYSLALNTVLRARNYPKLTFRLTSGLVIAQFLLMTQITRQADLPSGGNSIDGTVGWGAVYLDWNGDGVPDVATDAPPNGYVDPLRFKLRR
jgi:hypothetical protein